MINIIYIFTNLISSLFKKNKKIIVTCGIDFNSFNENTKHLFLYLSQKKEFHTYWMTDNDKIFKFLKQNKYKVIKRKSFKSIVILIKAGFIISCGESYPNFLNLISKDTIKISLRHGAGPKYSGVSYKINEIKKISKLNDNGKDFIKEINKSDYINFASKNLAEIFINKFNISTKKIKIFGFPRCDMFFKKKIIQNLYLKKLITKKFFKINKKEKIILYAPTWRLNDKKLPIERLADFDWKNFDSFLKKKNYYCLINLHTYTNVKIKEKLERIKLINRTEFFDINELLPEIDVLITDYSAIATDFALLRRKILYVIPDYKQYKKINGFFRDIINFNAGVICQNSKNLFNNLVNENISEIEKKKNNQYLKFYYDTKNKNSNQNIYMFLKNFKFNY